MDNNDGFLKRTGKQALGERAGEAAMIAGSIFLFGVWGTLSDTVGKVESGGILVSSFSLAMVGLTSWLNVMQPRQESAWKSYALVATLLIYLMSNGMSIGHITAGIANGGRMLVSGVYKAGEGAVQGATTGGYTGASATTTAFSDTDKGAYTGTIPCYSLDFSKAANANVQNGASGARDWCAAGATALDGQVSAKFARACGCGK
jgi:hypothetical protein